MVLFSALFLILGCGGTYYGKFGTEDVAEGCTYRELYRDWVCADPTCGGFANTSECEDWYERIVTSCWNERAYCVQATHARTCEEWMDDHPASQFCYEFPGDCAEGTLAEACPEDGGEGWPG